MRACVRVVVLAAGVVAVAVGVSCCVEKRCVMLRLVGWLCCVGMGYMCVCVCVGVGVCVCVCVCPGVWVSGRLDVYTCVRLRVRARAGSQSSCAPAPMP